VAVVAVVVDNLVVAVVGKLAVAVV